MFSCYSLMGSSSMKCSQGQSGVCPTRHWTSPLFYTDFHTFFFQTQNLNSPLFAPVPTFPQSLVNMSFCLPLQTPPLSKLMKVSCFSASVGSYTLLQPSCTCNEDLFLFSCLCFSTTRRKNYKCFVI